MILPMPDAVACKNCGAEPEAGRVSCGNCAAVSRYGLDEAEEQRAFDEFRGLLSRVASEKVPSLWRSAFVPEHWQPATRAFGHAINAVIDDQAASRAAYDRAQAIFNSAVLSNLGDPHIVAAAPIMKDALAHAWATAIQGERLEVYRQRRDRAQRRLWFATLALILAYLGVLSWVLVTRAP
jgi:predicted nucleic acid-binding Zn ribbon protein